jgi:hypothetical protein
MEQQLSIWDTQERILLTLPPGDYLYNAIVKIGDKVYYKQWSKNPKPKDDIFYHPPSYSELCPKKLKTGYFADVIRAECYECEYWNTKKKVCTYKVKGD